MKQSTSIRYFLTMAWWHEASGKPSQAAFRKIMRCMVRSFNSGKGVYLGELALELGLGISVVETLMLALVDDGTVRYMSMPDKLRFGIESASIVYELLVRPSGDVDDWVQHPR